MVVEDAEQPIGWARQVLVDPQRLARWTDRFRASHGPTRWTISGHEAVLSAADGAHARLGNPWEAVAPDCSPGAFERHLRRDRRVAVVLGRRGSHAVGIAEGPELVTSKVDRSYVQGRTKAGGWSQQRYARRRSNQTDKAITDTIERCLTRLVPELDTLEALVCGGDRSFIQAVLDDPRLAGLAALRTRHRLLPVPDPRQEVLREAIMTMCKVPIDLDEAALL